MKESEDASTAFELRDEDLPALFRAADEASKRNQSRYLWLVKIDLTCIVTGALLGSVQVTSASLQTLFTMGSALLLLAGLILTLTLGLKRFENLWFRSRAVAESVKTLSWRYSTRSPPFARENEDDSRNEEAFRQEFIDRLDAIGQSEARGLVLVTDPDHLQITTGMTELRDSTLEDRIAAYRNGRIQDQRRWYSDKASKSRQAEQGFFFALVAVQTLAVLFSFSTLAIEIAWNPAGTFAAVATAIAAWLQVKQHQELAETYSSTSHALGNLDERAKGISTEERLREFVADAENAISREHTSWLARRDH